ncbi:MAG TPA: SDR family oxidoreductase [Puia sp.]
MTQPLALDGKVVVVTGATGSMGKSFIDGIAEAGGAVGILGRNRKVAEDRATQINLNGGKAIALCADVTNRHDLANARRVMLDTYGKIDGLVNAAGGTALAKRGESDDIFEGRIEEVKKAMELNLWGTVLPTLVFGDAIARYGEGSIVNISSMAARRVVDKSMGYTVAKAAIEAFTRWFAVELGRRFKDAIRMNSIAPGCFLTERNHDHLTNPDGTYTKMASDIIGLTPVGRLGEPDDLKGALVWLLSDQSKFVTGTTITVDGGFMANGGI